MPALATLPATTAPAPTTAPAAPKTATVTAKPSPISSALARPPVSSAGAAPAAPAGGSSLVPEVATPGIRHTMFPNGMPGSQISMLHDLASLSLEYADPVSPGQVTKGQQQVLSAWRENASSDYSQYMLDRGLSALAANPQALFNEEAATAQAQWSAADNKGALDTLQLSAKDWDAYMKLEEKKHESAMHKIFGVVEIAAGIAVGVFFGWTGVALGASASLIAAGGEQLSQ